MQTGFFVLSNLFMGVSSEDLTLLDNSRTVSFTICLAPKSPEGDFTNCKMKSSSYLVSYKLFMYQELFPFRG